MSTIGATIKDGMPALQTNPYVGNVIKTERYSSVVEGSFYQAKPITVREMVTRKINKSLCICLFFTIAITFVSYYIAMNYEAGLNRLDREIVRINTENQDIQADLDRYKSFNNVDNRVAKLQLLQKANKVIEVTDSNAIQTIASPKKASSTDFNWAIGY